MDFSNILDIGRKTTRFSNKVLSLVAWKNDGINQRNR